MRKKVINELCPCIIRATTEVQARTKKWWARHPGCLTHIAIVADNRGYVPDSNKELYCGTLRELYPDGSRHEGILCLETGRRRVWRVLEENPIQIDTEDGTAWQMEIADWLLPDVYTPGIQTAIIASSGLNDEDLARMLKVKSSDIKNWYTGKTAIPTKVIKDIVKKFIYG